MTLADETPVKTEKFKVQADDGKVVEVTGRILAQEKKAETPVPAEPQSQP